MKKVLKNERYNGWAKKLFYILVLLVLLEVIYLVVARVEHSSPRSTYCSQAYRCKVDEDNPEYLNCVYMDENEKENDIKCPNNDYEVNSYE